MRLYVLVLSFSPLVVYVYREGFARFSSKRYESKIKSNSTENYFVHLTNHSVQRKGDSYNASVCDLKWPLHKLRRHIRSTFDARAEEACFKEIECMIKLSCDAVKSSMIRDERCFELYGYDVMLDEHLKPWLIEVNASPSMTADSASDKELKTRVFEDVLNCVDFENKFTTGTTKEERVQAAVRPVIVITTAIDRHSQKTDKPIVVHVASRATSFTSWRFRRHRQRIERKEKLRQKRNANDWNHQYRIATII